ncbi:response regulator [Ruficoccus amylovorans]|uniref:Response regulator n=1 Tax=Ruficoccus amylovorans TaxID=1804625 RepID=A0A842HH81_9BACT|nr:response regulator [Ruficoccus amylovorans]MBC2595772.1 response regulator [Ruficoccus amylovorans]
MARPTVLVVDDIPGVHDMLDIIFGDAGYLVEHALRGKEALDIYRRGGVDVVFTDIQMPGMDGLELLRALRELDEDVTVIMTTAIDSKNYAIESLRLGAFDYVEKPYDEDALTRTINRALRHRHKRLEQRESRPGDPALHREVERLRQDIQARDNALSALARKAGELEKSLRHREEELEQQKLSQHSLRKRQQDLELREDALKTMDDTLRERMQALKLMQQQRRSGGELTPEAEETLNRLRQELQTRESELAEIQLSMEEREQFLRESEESLMAKGQRLSELEAELEQMREDLDRRQQAKGLSPEELQEIETLKNQLGAKENALREAEDDLSRREEAVRRAASLLKAREQFLQESENILFGGDKE